MSPDHVGPMNGSQISPKHSDRSFPSKPDNAERLRELLQELERVTAEYNRVLAEVRTHQDCIAREHAALGELGERLVRIRAPTRESERRLWNMA